MAKNRKTRQQKEISLLRRKLARAQLIEPRQEAKLAPSLKPSLEISKPKNPDTSVFFYDPSLIKKDLVRTFLITLIVLGLEIMLYLRLR